MNIWNRNARRELWDNQIIAVINAETAACPKRQAAFSFPGYKRIAINTESERKKQMRKRYFGIYRIELLPQGEMNKEEQIKKR